MARRLVLIVAMLCHAMLGPMWAGCGAARCAPPAAAVGAAGGPGCCCESGAPGAVATSRLCCCDTGECCAGVDEPKRPGEAVESWRDPSYFRVMTLAIGAVEPRVLGSGGAGERPADARRAWPAASGERRALLCVRTV